MPEKKVLIIEDDPLILDILAHKFTHSQWEVISVLNGEQGLTEIEKHKPSVILLDILLPGMSGHEVLERLKESEELKDIPVLVLSNFGQTEEIERSIELGAIDHYVKANVILDDVVHKVSAIIGVDQEGEGNPAVLPHEKQDSSVPPING